MKNKKIKNDKNKELLIKNGFQKIRLNEQFSIKFQDHEVKKVNSYLFKYILSNNKIPELIDEVFVKSGLVQLISSITGFNYNIGFITAYMTKNIPIEQQSSGWYANHWHNDKPYSRNTLKVIVPIKEICDQHGGIEIMDKNESIKMSYDVQSGSYIKFFNSLSKKKIHKIYNPLVQVYFNEFKDCKTILDFGCGELTTSLFFFKKIKKKINHYFANDISLNRRIVGKNYIKKKLNNRDFKKFKIFCNSEINLPFKNNSIDLIVTIHSLEPNNKSAKHIIKELLRVSKKGLILMEPHYEISNLKQKKRMKKYNFVRGLPKLLNDKNYDLKIIKKKEHSNNLNISSLFILKKKKIKSNSSNNYVEPKTLNNIKKYYNFFYSNKSFRLFPVFNEIPIFTNDSQFFLPSLKKTK